MPHYTLHSICLSVYKTNASSIATRFDTIWCLTTRQSRACMVKEVRLINRSACITIFLSLCLWRHWRVPCFSFSYMKSSTNNARNLRFDERVLNATHIMPAIGAALYSGYIWYSNYCESGQIDGRWSSLILSVPKAEGQRNNWCFDNSITDIIRKNIEEEHNTVNVSRRTWLRVKGLRNHDRHLKFLAIPVSYDGCSQVSV